MTTTYGDWHFARLSPELRALVPKGTSGFGACFQLPGPTRLIRSGAICLVPWRGVKLAQHALRPDQTPSNKVAPAGTLSRHTTALDRRKGNVGQGFTCGRCPGVPVAHVSPRVSKT